MHPQLVELFAQIVDLKGVLEAARAEAKVYKEELANVRQDVLRKDVMIMELTQRIPKPVNYSDGPD
jgi:hypothetical protein